MSFPEDDVGEQTSTVRYEPCDGWSAGPDLGSASCAECGWFEEDHWMAELERRPATAAAVREPVSASA